VAVGGGGGAGEKWEGKEGAVNVFGALSEFSRFRSFWRQQRRQFIGGVGHVEERLRNSLRAAIGARSNDSKNPRVLRIGAR
jgi:hypothetical protein